MNDSLNSFWLGRNPAPSSRLPYLLRLPVAGEGRIFLAAADTWPRGKDVYCQERAEWPGEADIIEEVPVEACWRSGAAVHLTLRRARARRSLFLWTRSHGREVIFWRSQTSMRGARPGVRVPQARGLAGPLEIAVDVAERYPWRFAHQQARTVRRGLPVGDYAVLRDGAVVAAVERKRVADLAHAAVDGQLALTLGELGSLRHAALVVEGRLSDVIKEGRRGDVRPGWLLNVLAALQVAHPRVSWMFAETPRLAQEWAHRWLAACARDDRAAADHPARAPAIGEPVFQPTLPYGPTLLDANARRAVLLSEARAGRAWTSGDAAARCRVTQPTAARDLKGLVRDGLLRAQGSRRAPRYVAAGSAPAASEVPPSDAMSRKPSSRALSVRDP
ncbi:MAG: ERCC4 domain-containing protein [Chloroflexota bacterium]|nr:ERCC4 domain-containing protein [Chloroflexota bacterium]